MFVGAVLAVILTVIVVVIAVSVLVIGFAVVVFASDVLVAVILTAVAVVVILIFIAAVVFALFYLPETASIMFPYGRCGEDVEARHCVVQGKGYRADFFFSPCL